MVKSSNLKYIYKINSTRLRKAKWNLNLTIKEAVENDELVQISDSNTLRLINIINNDIKKDNEVSKIKNAIKKLKEMTTSVENRKLIKENYIKLFEKSFVKDYICVIIDKDSDFDKMNSKKGFYINGIKFKRLLGTNGGVKKSTIVYINSEIYENLNNRIENGRNKNKPFVPAKFEAYKSLSCSGSIPVSNPEGILVVKDCITKFKSNVIKIDDTESDYPRITYEENFDIELIDSDGYGLISPQLSEKWGKELGENYIPSGFCVRNAFCKGMVFTFDFYEFANKIAKKDIVIDVWGNEININNVQIILTTSMLKLWDSYTDINHYLECCHKNGFSFSISKITPKVLENSRNLNYQFIQSLKLNDSEINELIKPTVDEINDVLGFDYRKSILFLKGIHINDDDFNFSDNDYIKALMIDKRLIYDPFIRNKIYNMIQKRITEAKVGCLKVRGNFSVVSGDPYSLCQSIFNLEVTGLLKSGEFYSKYWNDLNIDKVACFRAPMTCHNNIRILRFKNNEKLRYWYKYMNTITIFNSWDTSAHALNGLDKDADAVLTTDCKIIVDNIRELEAIVCVQKTAEKVIITEEHLIQSNKDSFGDLIGSTTNRITNMFDVLANFDEDSEEYSELMHRICCGQNYQQNAIDKAKGIKCKPMPKEWYNYKSNKILDTDTEEIKQYKELNLRILADKKPYFFTYIYPNEMKQYKTFIKNSNKNCIIKFGITVDELVKKEDKSESELNFLKYYYKKMPVSISNSVMNNICRKIENIFDNIDLHSNSDKFDYTILKTQKQYSKGRYNAIKQLYDDYCEKTKIYTLECKINRIDKDEKQVFRSIFKESFKREAFNLCNDEDELCNIVVDICYKSNKSKQFAWDICGDTIVKNLLELNNYTINYPLLNKSGDLEFGGERFIMKTVNIMEDQDENYIE